MIEVRASWVLAYKVRRESRKLGAGSGEVKTENTKLILDEEYCLST